MKGDRKAVQRPPKGSEGPPKGSAKAVERQCKGDRKAVRQAVGRQRPTCDGMSRITRFSRIHGCTLALVLISNSKRSTSSYGLYLPESYLMQRTIRGGQGHWRQPEVIRAIALDGSSHVPHGLRETTDQGCGRACEQRQSHLAGFRAPLLDDRPRHDLARVDLPLVDLQVGVRQHPARPCTQVRGPDQTR